MSFIRARRRRPRTSGCRTRPASGDTRGAGGDGVPRNAIGHAGCRRGEAAPSPSPPLPPGLLVGGAAWGFQTDAGYEWGARRDRGGEGVPGAALGIWEDGTAPHTRTACALRPRESPSCPLPIWQAQPWGAHPTDRLHQLGAPELLRGSPGWPQASRAGGSRGGARGCRGDSSERGAAASLFLSRTLQSESKARGDGADHVLSYVKTAPSEWWPVFTPTSPQRQELQSIGRHAVAPSGVHSVPSRLC